MGLKQRVLVLDALAGSKNRERKDIAVTRILCGISAGAMMCALATAVTISSVEARPNTGDYSCAGLRDFIASRGAVTMNTKSANVYQRFVANRSQCIASQGLDRVFAPARGGQCLLRICVQQDIEDSR